MHGFSRVRYYIICIDNVIQLIRLLLLAQYLLLTSVSLIQSILIKLPKFVPFRKTAIILNQKEKSENLDNLIILSRIIFGNVNK